MSTVHSIQDVRDRVRQEILSELDKIEAASRAQPPFSDEELKVLAIWRTLGALEQTAVRDLMNVFLVIEKLGRSTH